MNPTKKIRKFNKQAVRYDNRRSKGDLAHLRAPLIGRASGKVLELGAGAGANLPYYRPDVILTAVDFSPAMLSKAREANNRHFNLSAEFREGNVDTIDLPEQSFDTVVSTLSLCAYHNPEKALLNMNRWCKPDGRVLLMEHGLSSRQAMALAQKTVNPLAYRLFGCHQNRDVLSLIRRSPLKIEWAASHMAGMLHVMVCHPS
ncbi:class I SAM-dependent methyltransferase [Paenibacillus aurantius]|uniref:Class I SAM-dependent methyltransferase n=1 Tax=Paenibacillus aurantius TaxID=2918900 RepID=A0AA96LJC5_9BACL|nr:class I SAM-dependent methyltransferase [Paenibacillus aurantius]WNQ14073.1 class I SAM-dependent methyltransferase [Paenibacillus aurantius]